MRSAMRILALNLIAVASLAGAAQAGAFVCRETPIVTATERLNGLAPKIAAGGKLDILAIGSSSTEGVGASTREKSYPSRLQALLTAAWPRVQVTVANAGIGGEVAPQTLARLKQALTERRYDLVIWQVGTNDAVRGGDMAAFKAMVSDGIALVRQAGPSLALLDPQFFPGIREPARYRAYVEAIGTIAKGQSVPVFTRYDTMREWHAADERAFAAALAPDSFHMSDAGYDCLARDMAAGLVSLTATGRPIVAQGR
ncbi:SGNH/GDSL hydrolase family protein [Bosea sp. (in: a-proteobacteria)]|uniref:SGNH/GDSL hydrolase family protein n=1 Tax=Bosea sp. (in: a-proteobacteria) TaxID=1871050 RepID=UPI00273312EA|nr:SGNH/GDSL hydrolase family protein [Bosea sp. (in: a-proteobacteria)]